METDIDNLSDNGKKTEGKTLEIFIVNSDSGELKAHCGTAKDRPGTLKAIGHFIAAEFDSLVEHDGNESVEIWLEGYWMTPEEIANLPDI
jgi:hypothetical protein